MITNNSVTIYHKTINNTTRLEEWTRHNYNKVWWFGSLNANANEGYENNNSVEVRIPYDKNDVDMSDISIGDILVEGTLTTNITTQKELSNYNIYNIISIKDNKFGNNPHLHLGGK